jgi:hypothetical protein
MPNATNTIDNYFFNITISQNFFTNYVGKEYKKNDINH